MEGCAIDYQSRLGDGVADLPECAAGKLPG